jgi:cation diffusion facilitator CzcD-associated flavoprotein CzcO
MYTLGYSFKPWYDPNAIAGGGKILNYIRETARQHDIERHVRFGHKVKRAQFSSADATWTVEAECGGELKRFRCNFLFSCTGYYSYEGGYLPQFPGSETFRGQMIHPQKWPTDLDYTGKQIVVIGSGATAVTLVPAMADSAAKVTMLQRSPGYIFSLPQSDRINDALRRYLPKRLAYHLIRWRNILFGVVFFALCKRNPTGIKRWLIKQVEAAMGPDFDVAKHFTPAYNPWDQRLCLVPDGDLFKAVSSGKAAVVTDQIDSFTPGGVRLRSGAELPADIVVTATGLELVALGGMQLSVDGAPVDIAKTLTYRGCMFSGVPNLAVTIGYTNASWTLKAELTFQYVCRLLNYMDRRNLPVCVPQNNDGSLTEEPWLNLNSGYIQRASERLPKQGSKMPWKLRQNYLLDLMMFRYSNLNDGVLRFSRAAREGVSLQPS